jgi:histone H3/H4
LNSFPDPVVTMAARKDRIIPLASLDRILVSAGVAFADLDATKQLGQLLETLGLEILETAITLTKHAGRKTITDADITLAFDYWRANRGPGH